MINRYMVGLGTMPRSFLLQPVQTAGLLLLLSGSLSSLVANTQDDRAHIEIHADKLAWWMNSWDSVDLTVRETLIRAPDADAVPLELDKSMVSRYRETASGKRFLELLSFGADENRPFRTIEYFDGERGASLAYDRNDPQKLQQAILHRHFSTENRLAQTSHPFPLRTYWVDQTPLQEAIWRAKFLGEKKVLDRDCHAFLFEEKGLSKKQELVYSLDQETSTPLKFEVYLTPRDRASEQPYQVWTATKVETVQDYPIVMEAEEQDYWEDQGKLSMSRHFLVESISFNKTFPNSAFWPELTPDVNIFDTITNQPSLPTPEQIKASEAARARPAPIPEKAIRAKPPRTWSDYATPVSMALGVILLITSLTLMWRRR